MLEVADKGKGKIKYQTTNSKNLYKNSKTFAGLKAEIHPGPDSMLPAFCYNSSNNLNLL